VATLDLNLKSLATTGSITGGTPTLVVTSNPGFSISDWIIVPVGGESTFNGRAGGMRGTKGVGGNWPALSYANEATMFADRTLLDWYYAWAEDTGLTYRWELGNTNLLAQPEAFNHAAWTKDNLSVSADAVTGPFGTLADTVTDDTTNSYHRVVVAGQTLTAAVHNFSVFVKAGTLSWVQLVIHDGGSGENYYANFNVSTGVVGAKHASVTSAITGNYFNTSVSLGGGWYRISMQTPVLTGSAGADNSNIAMLDANTASVLPSYSGTGKTLHWFGAKLEAAAAISQYPAWTKLSARADYQDYYFDMGVPKALLAQIINIVGTTFTLDRNATVTATNANVYFDNTDLIQDIVTDGNQPDDLELVVAAGDFAISRKITIASITLFVTHYYDNWTLRGAGRDSTRIFTPDGVASISCIFLQTTNCTIKDIHFEGNARLNGFGLQWEGSTDRVRGDGAGYGVEEDIAVGRFQGGIGFGTGAGIGSLGTMRDLRVTDGFAPHYLYGGACTNSWTYNCQSICTEPFLVKDSWLFQTSSTGGGGFVDCSIDSDWLVCGYETATSEQVSFIRCSGRNIICSSNSSAEIVWEDLDITVEANSQSQIIAGQLVRNILHVEPMLNINANFGVGSASATITRPHLVQEGHINASSESLTTCILLNSSDNVTITGDYLDCDAGDAGYLEHPDFAAGGGGSAISAADCENLTIDGIRIVGINTSGTGNIRSILGVNVDIRNCVAESIVNVGLAPTFPDLGTENILTNEEWSAGCFITEQETLSNTVPPIVSGTLTKGSTLFCTTGSWSTELVTYSYQWRRNGENILDARSPSYLITQSDTGQQLSCIVTAIGIQRSVSQISNSVTIQDYRTSTYVKRKGIRKGFYN
jgi:hypothetical protein